MSFINQVLAEAGSRKDILLFDDYSVLNDVDFPPIYNSGLMRMKYWRNFILVLLLLLIALYLVNRLPVRTAVSLQADKTISVMPAPQILEGVSVSHQPVPATHASAAEKLIENVDKPVPLTELSSEKMPENISANQPEKIQATLVEVSSPVIPEVTVDDHFFRPVLFEKKPVGDPALIQADEKFSQALQLLRQGNQPGAIHELQQALTLYDGHAEVRLLLSDQLIELHRPQDAEQLLQEGLTLHPGETRFAQPLAHLLVEAGRVDEALAILLQAAPAIHQNSEYHSFIAALQQQKGRHAEAIRTYQQILNVDQKKGKWWLGLGISQMAVARYAEALTAFKMVLRDPTVSPALKQFAMERINDLKKRGS